MEIMFIINSVLTESKEVKNYVKNVLNLLLY